MIVRVLLAQGRQRSININLLMMIRIKGLLILLDPDRIIGLTADGASVFAIVYIRMELPVSTAEMSILGRYRAESC